MKKDSYKWTETIPAAVDVVIKGKTYKMDVFTLDDASFFEDKYGLVAFYKKMNETPTSIFSEIAFRLMRDEIKKDFPTLDDFRRGLTVQEAGKSDLIENTMKAVGRCLEKVEAEELGSPANAGKFSEKPRHVRPNFGFIKSLFRIK